MKDHRLIDQRSLAFGHAIADKLKDHPELIATARATLFRWLETCSPGTLPALLEWLTALDSTREALIAILTGEDEHSVQLRQSNPFAGTLSAQERNAILLQFDAYEKTRA